MKLGVVVGRFQTPELHQGHVDLICRAKADNDHVLVLVGVAAITGTKRNPLDYATRESMIMYSNLGCSPTRMTVEPLKDVEDDDAWSKNLDNLIEAHIKYGDNVVLYGGEDSFLNCYTGRHSSVRLNTVARHRGTETRKEVIAKRPEVNVSFRNGVIYGLGNSRDTVACTVDVAMLKQIDKRFHVLAGRKEGESKWRLPGGFVDATDKNMNEAARREFFEETGLSIEDDLTYLGSNLVDDWRFRNSPDKAVMTTLFGCHYSFGEPKANDDLIEVKWLPFDVADGIKNFNKGHRALIYLLWQALEADVL